MALLCHYGVQAPPAYFSFGLHEDLVNLCRVPVDQVCNAHQSEPIRRYTVREADIGNVYVLTQRVPNERLRFKYRHCWTERLSEALHKRADLAKIYARPKPPSDYDFESSVCVLNIGDRASPLTLLVQANSFCGVAQHRRTPELANNCFGAGRRWRLAGSLPWISLEHWRLHPLQESANTSMDWRTLNVGAGRRCHRRVVWPGKSAQPIRPYRQDWKATDQRQRGAGGTLAAGRPGSRWRAAPDRGIRVGS